MVIEVEFWLCAYLRRHKKIQAHMENNHFYNTVVCSSFRDFTAYIDKYCVMTIVVLGKLNSSFMQPHFPSTNSCSFKKKVFPDRVVLWSGFM